MRTKLTTLMVMVVLFVILTACSTNQAEPEATDNSQIGTNTNDAVVVTQRAMSTQPMAQTGGANTATSETFELRLADGASSEQQVLMLGEADADIEVESFALQAPVDPNAVVDEEQSEAVTGEEPDAMFFEDYGVNPFFDTAQDNLSTFAMDVDTASYTLARSYLIDYSQMPPAESIRVEEFVNYFPPAYEAPSDGTAFAINMSATPSPFSEDNQVLLRVGVQGRVVAPEDRDPALLIFVIDISGSMSGAERLGLVKESLAVLVGELREDDRVGIVVYADRTRVVLEPTPASEQERIINAINSLQTEGSTYAEAGLALGYEVAQAHMREDQITRVILLSDGVANVGETGPDAILETVSEGVENGITLSTVGFGMGNFNDTLMEQLANDGNGNYFYVDNIREARRIFVNNLTSTLQVIGYDARIQVEFNPDVVARYRLLGYENREIADELFRDDTVDAGEVGAGHTITALYELEFVENVQSGTVATAYLRYEDADSDEVVEINEAFEMSAIMQSFEQAPLDFQITATVAELSEILRQSPYGTSEYDELLAIVQPLSANYPSAAEITEMIRAAIRLS